MVGDIQLVPWRGRSTAGNGSGLGWSLMCSKTARKGKAGASFNAPERGKKRRPKKGVWGCLPAPESATNSSRDGGSGDSIWAAWGRIKRGERERMREGI
jgi:hypothetical protein